MDHESMMLDACPRRRYAGARGYPIPACAPSPFPLRSVPCVALCLPPGSAERVLEEPRRC